MQSIRFRCVIGFVSSWEQLVLLATQLKSFIIIGIHVYSLLSMILTMHSTITRDLNKTRPTGLIKLTALWYFVHNIDILTHWGRVMQICAGTLIITGSENSLHVAWTAPSHFLNQSWNIVNWTLMNKLQWNFNRDSYIFIQENALENVVCEMVSILSRPQSHFYVTDKIYKNSIQLRHTSIQWLIFGIV